MQIFIIIVLLYKLPSKNYNKNQLYLMLNVSKQKTKQTHTTLTNMQYIPKKKFEISGKLVMKKKILYKSLLKNTLYFS